MTRQRVTEAPTPEVGASSPYRKFDRYTMFTLYAVTPMAPLISLLLLAEARAYSWATVAHLAAIVVAAVLCALVLRAAIRHHAVERPWPKALVAAFAVACLAAAVFGTLAAPPGTGAGMDIPTALALLSLVTLAFGFSPAMSWRHIGWFSLAVTLPTVLVWVLLHPQEVGSGRWFPVLFTAGFGSFGVLMSGSLAAWTLRQMREQAELTEVRAELAVAEERLRFSRDLHDIFGRTLTAVAVKSDLAAELATAGQVERATVEMREVQGIADEALREVRAVVAGYRAVDLGAELKGARAMLGAAGIRARLIGDATGIPARAAEALAWVVREGTTNVVHHSEASNCTITIASTDGWAQVTITNDGVTARGPREGGGGLEGLRARLGPLGGTVTSEAGGGSFTLTARVPEETP